MLASLETAQRFYIFDAERGMKPELDPEGFDTSAAAMAALDANNGRVKGWVCREANPAQLDQWARNSAWGLAESAAAKAAAERVRIGNIPTCEDCGEVDEHCTCEDSQPERISPRETWEVVEVDGARLEYGVWNHATEQDEREGDIRGSYSADCIAFGQGVRKPFQFRGSFWINTGSSSGGRGGRNSAECYRVVPVRVFDGKPTTYQDKVNRNPADEFCEYSGDTARNDPKGFYHGMKVKLRGESFVLCGPPLVFSAAVMPDGSPVVASPAQLSLF